MARRPQTKEQIASRVAKAQATKAAKKNVALAQMGVDVKRSIKKARKPRNLTPEQKQAAVERLKKAREARTPSTNSIYADTVRALPDEDPLSLINVKSWIKFNKEQLHSMKGYENSKDAQERNQYNATETYIANLENYLRTGVYNDLFYGLNAQSKIQYRCVAMAYYADGTPKRTPGVHYPDIGLYSNEMAQEDNERRKTISNKTKVYKTR